MRRGKSQHVGDAIDEVESIALGPDCTGDLDFADLLVELTYIPNYSCNAVSTYEIKYEHNTVYI